MDFTKPYRLVLVIDEQWRDPGSRVLDSNHADAELLDIASLLRLWNIPFDVLRLDQQRLEINSLLDANLNPLYGGIVWMARPDHVGDIAHDWSTLRTAVHEHGIPLLALGNDLSAPGLSELLGVAADGVCLACLKPSQKPMTITGEHPMVADLQGHAIPDPANYTGNYWQLARAKATDAAVLAQHDHFDAATVRQHGPTTSAIWIGGDLATMYRRHLADSEPLLRRAITWMLGRTLIHSQRSTAILTMDDPGMPLSRMYAWHAPSLTEAQVRELMIEPLKRRGAKLTINVIPGYIDHEQRMIVPAWRQQFTDPFGQRQDMVELKRSIDAGIAQGVFEVQSHGWTHLTPDLDSPPGPYHDAATDGERSHNGWYGEFEDRRRGREVPAAVQRFRLRRSREAIATQFGQTPNCFRVSGGKYSKSLANHTFLAAAEVGFGIMLLVNNFYLRCNDGVLGVTSGGPRIMTCHDHDLHHEPDTIAQMCDQAERHCGEAVHYTTAEELCAYVNAQVDGAGRCLSVRYDAPFCRAFAQRESQWELAVAHWLRPGAGELTVRLNGSAVARVADQPVTLTLPAGLGTHTLELGQS